MVLEPGPVAGEHTSRRAARDRPGPAQRPAGTSLGTGARLQRRAVQAVGFLGHADEDPLQERSGVAVPPRRVGGDDLMAGVPQRPWRWPPWRRAPRGRP